MKSIISITISFIFLLQSFATVQAIAFQEGKAKMPCEIKQQTAKKHICCLLKETKKENSKKKNCCSGTSKMSCCVIVLAIYPPQFSYLFVKNKRSKTIFGNKVLSSRYKGSIFQPPILT